MHIKLPKSKRPPSQPSIAWSWGCHTQHQLLAPGRRQVGLSLGQAAVPKWEYSNRSRGMEGEGKKYEFWSIPFGALLRPKVPPRG